MVNLLASIRTKIVVILSVLIVRLQTSLVSFVSFALEKHHRIFVIHIGETDAAFFYLSSCSKTIQTWDLTITGDSVELSKKLAEFSRHNDGANFYCNHFPFFSKLLNVFDYRIRPYRVHNIQQVGFLRDSTLRKVRHVQ